MHHAYPQPQHACGTDEQVKENGRIDTARAANEHGIAFTDHARAGEGCHE
jgi:hypothetical protein